MSLAVSRPPSTSRRSRSRGGPRDRPRRGAGIRPRASTDRPSRAAILTSRPLARYTDAAGRPRELLVRPAHAGSVLVLDRDAATLCDRRLIAHLAADEPSENAQLVCRLYLEEPNGRWCRRIEPADLERDPLPASGSETYSDDVDAKAPIIDRDGNIYRLGLLPGERSGLQLRWSRRPAADTAGTWERVGMRDVVASIESYEPVRTLTERALARYRHERDSKVSLGRLQAELERLSTSPIVLNRRLREAVLETIHTRGLSMSEVAHRCGMVKCDQRGRLSGETSWLARRVGIMPEGGESQVTPWVHSDVLGLIARRGLGLSPREVEL
jgi:hypothetical protein